MKSQSIQVDPTLWVPRLHLWWKPPEIYRPRWFHKTWDGSNCFSYCRFTVLGRIWVSLGNARMGSMGKWPCHWTSTGQESSIKLEIEQISPAVVELMHLQSPNGWMDRWTGRDQFIVPLTLLWKDGDNNPIFFWGNVSESALGKMLAISSGPQCGKSANQLN